MKTRLWVVVLQVRKMLLYCWCTIGFVGFVCWLYWLLFVFFFYFCRSSNLISFFFLIFSVFDQVLFCYMACCLTTTRKEIKKIKRIQKKSQKKRQRYGKQMYWQMNIQHITAWWLVQYYLCNLSVSKIKIATLWANVVGNYQLCHYNSCNYRKNYFY